MFQVKVFFDSFDTKLFSKIFHFFLDGEKKIDITITTYFGFRGFELKF